MPDEYDELLDTLSPGPAKKTKARPSLDYRALYQEVGLKYGVDPDLLYSQAKQESVNFADQYVYGPGKSPKGAAGIAQFMPDTARQYGLNVGKGNDERYNPRRAADAQARMMRDLISKHGDAKLALAAYNSGHNKTSAQAAQSAKRIPETRGYVQKIAPKGDPYDQLLDGLGEPSGTTSGEDADEYDRLLNSLGEGTAPPAAPKPRPVDFSKLDIAEESAGQYSLTDPTNKKRRYFNSYREMEAALGQMGVQLQSPSKQDLERPVYAAQATPRADELVGGAGPVRKPSSLGELRTLDESEVARVSRTQAEIAAERTRARSAGRSSPSPTEALGYETTELVRRLDQQRQQEETDRVAAADYQRNKPEIDRLAAQYRQVIQAAGPEISRQGAPGAAGNWTAETLARGGAGLIESLGALARTGKFTPIGQLAEAIQPGTPDATADWLHLHQQALTQAAEEEGADRSSASRFASEIIGGFIGTAPELAAVSTGVGAIPAFAAGSAARAYGTRQPVIPAAVHGGLTGAAFEIAPHGRGLANAFARAGTVGAASVPVELAFGASMDDALRVAATNALMAGGPQAIRAVGDINLVRERAIKSPEPTVPPETQNRLQAADLRAQGAEVTSEPGARPRFRVSDEQMAAMQGVELLEKAVKIPEVVEVPPIAEAKPAPAALADAKYISEPTPRESRTVPGLQAKLTDMGADTAAFGTTPPVRLAAIADTRAALEKARTGKTDSEAPSEPVKGPSTTKAEMERLATRHFGATEDPKRAGFLLADGKMLDFSGGPYGYRQHVEISQMEGKPSIEQFMSATGAVRFFKSRGGGVSVEILRPLSAAQIRTITRVVDTDIAVDVVDRIGTSGGRLLSERLDHPNNTDIAKLLRKASSVAAKANQPLATSTAERYQVVRGRDAYVLEDTQTKGAVGNKVIEVGRSKALLDAETARRNKESVAEVGTPLSHPRPDISGKMGAKTPKPKLTPEDEQVLRDSGLRDDEIRKGYYSLEKAKAGHGWARGEYQPITADLLTESQKGVESTQQYRGGTIQQLEALKSQGVKEVTTKQAETIWGSDAHGGNIDSLLRRERGRITTAEAQHEGTRRQRQRAKALEPKVGTPVIHPDPAIHGKEIVAKTADNRVVVANPENKSGVSVVKPRDYVAESDTLREYGQKLTTDYTALINHRARREGFDIANEGNIRNYLTRLRRFAEIHNPEKVERVNKAEDAFASGKIGLGAAFAEQALSGTHDFASKVNGAKLNIDRLARGKHIEASGLGSEKVVAEVRRRTDIDARIEARRQAGEGGYIDLNEIREGLRAGKLKLDEAVKRLGELFPDRSESELRAMLGPQKERSLPKTLERSGRDPGTNLTYEELPNVKTLSTVTKRLKSEGPDALEDWYRSAPPSAERTATHQVLVDHLQAESVKLADTAPATAQQLRARAVELSNLEVKRATTAGQTVQAYAMLNKYTPAGVSMEVARAKVRGVEVPEAEQAAAAKTAVEHQKADTAVTKARAKVQTLEREEGISGEGPGAGPAKGRSKGTGEFQSVVSTIYRRRTADLDRAAKTPKSLDQTITELAPNERVAEGARRMIGDTDLSRWMRETRAKYGLDQEAATKLGQEAHALLRKARRAATDSSRMAALRRKYPDATTDELAAARADLDAAIARRRTAKLEMAKFFDRLEKRQQGYWLHAQNNTRAMTVGSIANHIRNAVTQTPRFLLERGTDIGEHEVRRAAKYSIDALNRIVGRTLYDTVGLESDFTYRSVSRNSLRVLQAAEKHAKDIAGEHPDEMARLFNNYSGGVEVPQLEHGPAATQIRRTVDLMFKGWDGAAKVVNFTNKLQEFHIRGAEFLAELDLHLRKDHNMTLEKFVSRYGVDAIPKELITKAVDKSLEVTFSANPGKNGAGGQLLNDLIKWGNYIPPTVSPIPFAKWTYNSLKFLYQYNPTGLIDVGLTAKHNAKISQEMKQIENNSVLSAYQKATEIRNLEGQRGNVPRAVARTLLGSAMLLTAYQLRSSEYAGKKWYQLKLPGIDSPIDTRPFGPFSTYLFIAEVARRVRHGEKPFTLTEIGQALGTTAGPGGSIETMASVIYDTIADITSGQNTESAWRKLQRLLKTEAGDFGRALLTPVKQVKDLIAAFDPEEGITRETGEAPFTGKIREAIPLASRGMPPAYRPTTAIPIHREHPAAAFFGVRTEHPPTFLQKQLDELHFSNKEILAPTGLPKIDAFEKRAMGPLMDQLSKELEADPEFIKLGPAQRADLIKDAIIDIREEVRDMGRAEMPEEYERLKEERAPRRKKELERELREQDNSPGLSKAIRLGVPLPIPQMRADEDDLGYRARLLQVGRARRARLDDVVRAGNFGSLPAVQQRLLLRSAVA